MKHRRSWRPEVLGEAAAHLQVLYKGDKDVDDHASDSTTHVLLAQARLQGFFSASTALLQLAAHVHVPEEGEKGATI